MHILWLDISSSFSHCSLAAPALDAQLDTRTRSLHRWSTAGGTLKTDPASVISGIVRTHPDMILSTIWLFNRNRTMEILGKVHRLLPETKIVLGGPEFLGNNRDFLESYPYVTAVFRGEGEEIYPKFIANPDSVGTLEGFCLIENGRYVDNGTARTSDFISAAPPEKSEFFSYGKPFIQIETSRGCFNTCRFCVSGGECRIQNLPMERIRERLDNAVAHGVREIRILDRTFNADTSRACAMLDLFKEYSGKLRFHTEIHPALISDTFMRKISSMPKGLLHMEAGIQSLDENVIRMSGRKGKASKALEGLVRIKEADVAGIHADLIAGLPGYTYGRLEKDMFTLMEAGADEIQLELLKLLPGTPFREHAEEYGIRFSPFPPYEVLQTEECSFEELSKAMFLSRMLDYWYNGGCLKKFFRELCRYRPDTPEKLYSTLGSTDFMEKSHSKESKASILFRHVSEHVPEMLPLLAKEWLEEGLSLKKEAGLTASMWKHGEKPDNPILDASSRTKVYYYIDDTVYDGRKRHWFMYDRDSRSSRPALVHTETLTP